jgi:hypothetical protein
MSELLCDAAGRRRSPATMPGFHAGRPPRNKGHRYQLGSGHFSVWLRQNDILNIAMSRYF